MGHIRNVVLRNVLNRTLVLAAIVAGDTSVQRFAAALDLVGDYGLSYIEEGGESDRTLQARIELEQALSLPPRLAGQEAASDAGAHIVELAIDGYAARLEALVDSFIGDATLAYIDVLKAQRELIAPWLDDEHA